jgi:hypothetical protein
MKECDNSTRKIHISSNFILSISLLVMFDTLLLRPSLHCNTSLPLHHTSPNYTSLHFSTLHLTSPNYTSLHFTTLHPTTHHYTSLHFTQLHFTTLIDTSLPIIYTSHVYMSVFPFTAVATSDWTNSSYVQTEDFRCVRKIVKSDF